MRSRPRSHPQPAARPFDGDEGDGDGDGAHDHDGGLAHDLGRLLGRRRALALIGGTGLVALGAGCGITGSNDDAATTSTTSTTETTTGEETTTSASTDGTTTTEASSEASCSTIPEETGGPFPGDGTNGPNVLAESGVVRSDITSSIGDASGTAEGVPLTMRFTVVDTADGCQPLTGAALYAWHCDREGNYSMYEGAEDQNYLRGVQEAGDDGTVTFTTIFPAAYSGRWPHVHFEVYPSLDAATSASDRLRTSQLAFPEDICGEVYATEGYEQSVQNLSQTSLDSDMVFSDGWSLQMGKMSGTLADGLTVDLTVPV